MSELYRQFKKYENDVAYVAHQGYDISELKSRLATMRTTVFRAGGKSTRTYKDVEALVTSYLVEPTKITFNLLISFIHLLEVKSAEISEIAKMF